MKILKFLFIVCLISNFSTTLKAITVDGYAYLENQNNHSGIKVLFEREVPTTISDSVYTDATGYFTIQLELGIYDIIYSKDGYFNVWRYDQQIISNTTLTDANLLVPPVLVNVPLDFQTIQSAINHIYSGDTVLVAPGTYVENINFSGKNIVVGSLTLTTGDTSYIYQTLIDGNSSGTVVTFTEGEDSSAILCGFTIENGYSGNGGGIDCFDSNPSLTYLKISNNTVSHDGGGIRCANSNPNLNNVTITGNNAFYDGGGIHCANSNPILTNVTIVSNNADDYGGGIYCYNSNPNLTNAVIDSNTSGQYAGGIYCRGHSNLILTNVTMTCNNGGGIYCSYSNPILSNVMIKCDKASTDTATYYGDAIRCIDSSPILINVNITVNNGSGIRCYNSSPIIFNSIFSDNYYGIYVVSGNPSIFYSDFYNNEFGNFHNCGQWVGVNIATNANGDSIDFYNNIQANHKFVDKENGDFRLSIYSHCIGAGANSVEINGTKYYAPLTDLDGNPRPNPPGSNPDMGAYENIGSYPVPVELASFKAICKKNKVELNWSTLSETNNIGFQIERSQVRDSFYVIGFIKGHGTTSQPQSYYFIDENLESDHYFYRLKQIDSDGSFSYSEVVEVTVNQPKKFSLSQNYPNPFNPKTKISFDIPERTKAILTILNIRGERIKTLLNKEIIAGHYDIEFNANDLVSGLYFYRIECKEFVDVKKMLLVR